MSRFKHVFKTFLEKYPIIGNSLIYGTLCISAEASQQILTKKILEKPSRPIDKSSIGRYAIYGTAIAGPLLTVWYQYLDKKIPGTATTRIVIKKLLIDQFFFTPQLLAIFYISMSILERKQDLLEECRNKFASTFTASCLFWIPAQTINFSVVPNLYRVTYIGTCSFAWINILCFFKRQSSSDTIEEKSIEYTKK